MTVAVLDLISASEIMRVCSVSGRVKSGAFVPSGSIFEGVSAIKNLLTIMVVLLLKSGILQHLKIPKEGLMVKKHTLKKLFLLMTITGSMVLPHSVFAAAFQLWEQDGASVGNYHAG